MYFLDLTLQHNIHRWDSIVQVSNYSQKDTTLLYSWMKLYLYNLYNWYSYYYYVCNCMPRYTNLDKFHHLLDKPPLEIPY